jgi:acyl dehydratase
MNLEIGQSCSTVRTFTQDDFNAFAVLSGDDNPIHVDAAFAARTGFGRTVAHGMLLYGTICGLLSRHFPGAVQIEQHFTFPAPTYVGEAMTVQAEVMAVDAAAGQIRLKTTLTDPDGQLTCDGETVLEWKERQGVNALAKKQRRINPAESENSPIDRALFSSPVVNDRAGLVE